MTDDHAGDNPEVKDGDDAGDQEVAIGDEKLNADEAAELIKSGKSFKELTEKYPDIDFNELPGSFTKARQELAQIKKKDKQAPAEDFDEAEITRRKEIDGFFDDPYVQSKLSKTQEQKEQALREDLEFQKVMESLETEFDGSDGRPKFDKKAVLEYGMKNQIFNPRTAYKEMHEKELDEWKIKNAMSKPRPSTFFEKRGGQGSKQPEVKTPTNFKEATRAALENEE